MQCRQACSGKNRKFSKNRTCREILVELDCASNLATKMLLLPRNCPSSRLVNRPFRQAAFTILEVLVSAALLTIVALVSFSIVSSISSAWKEQKARVSAFEGARVGFEILTERLSQATLNTYWDYNDPARPTRYIRQSDLHFILGEADSILPDSIDNVVTDSVFFIAPLGFGGTTATQPLFKMLTACGFYVRFSDDLDRPDFLTSRVPSRFRYRLYQYLQPGEELSIFTDSNPRGWYQDALESNSFPMIDNVVGLILKANYRGTTDLVSTYAYDSQSVAGGSSAEPPITFNQLPSSLSVALVVIDEDSARRLADRFGTQPPDLQPEAPPGDDAANYAAYLQAWEDKLKNFVPRINYRILTAEVPIKGAKWSSQ